MNPNTDTQFAHGTEVPHGTTHRQIAPLVYNGEVIHQRDEMLSLTDMWRAAGSPSGRAPPDWIALASSQEFIACVEAGLNAGISGIKTRKGRYGGGTEAHWQVGLAYAKYLSPEFHMWCNTVVRDRMEGRSVDVAPRVSTCRIIADFRAYRSLGKMIGLDPNQAILAANHATKKIFGVDVLADIGHTHLIAPTQERILTPTDIGVELGGRSAVAINALLSDKGFQVGRRDGNDKLTWEPTEAGLAYAVFQDTGKKQGGTPVRQLKWNAGIVERLRAA